MNNACSLASSACLSFWQTVRRNPAGAVVFFGLLGLIALLEGTRAAQEIEDPSLGDNLFGNG